MKIGMRHINLFCGMIAWFLMVSYSAILPIGFINCGLFVAAFNIWAYGREEDKFDRLQRIETKVANNGKTD